MPDEPKPEEDLFYKMEPMLEQVYRKEGAELIPVGMQTHVHRSTLTAMTLSANVAAYPGGPTQKMPYARLKLCDLCRLVYWEPVSEEVPIIGR